MSSNSNNAWLARIQRWLTPPFVAHKVHTFANSFISSRSENQDNYLLIRPNGEAQWLQDQSPTSTKLNWSNEWYRLAIADGMGGHLAGREIATQLIKMLMHEPFTYSPKARRQAVYRIHQQLYQHFFLDDNHNSGSTLIWVDVHISGFVLAANIGDSRLYCSHAQGEWQLLTHDHHSAEFDWREQMMAGTQLEPPILHTNRLAQAMGFGSFGLIADENGYRPRRFSEHLRLDLAEDLPSHIVSHADVFSFYLAPDQGLLLASDGLWSTPQTRDMAFPAITQFHHRAASTQFYDLIEHYATLASDNTTAILFSARRV